jgi:transcription factor C subunit 6
MADDASDTGSIAFGTGPATASTHRADAQRGHLQLAPGLVRSSTRQMYARPVPSMHHRHRSVPLHYRASPVERLTAPPCALGPDPPVIPTTSGTGHPVVLDRTARAWAVNVGPGPLWEVAEDRAWFKEAELEGENLHAEDKRRPKMYADVALVMDWQVLDAKSVSFFYCSHIGFNLYLTTERLHRTCL